MFAHHSIQDLSSEAKHIHHCIYPLANYRLSSVTHTLGARRQEQFSARWDSFFTEMQNFSRFIERVSRNHHHQAYSAEGSLIDDLYRLATIAFEPKICCRKDNYLSFMHRFFILHIYYIIFFIKNQIGFVRCGFWSG